MRPVSTLLELAYDLAQDRPIGASNAPIRRPMDDAGAPKRRAGVGEDFWQFRPYQAGDSIKAIDWKRSGKSQSVFIKQREETNAPSIGFWCDINSGFDWCYAPSTGVMTKAECAVTCQLAVAITLSRAGFLTSVLSESRRGGRARGMEALADALADDRPFPEAPQKLDYAIIASDFYDPIEDWEARLEAVFSADTRLILLRIIDSAEVDFPFSGRVEFVDPVSSDTRLLGRAETLRREYQTAFDTQTAQLQALAQARDWGLLTARNADPMAAVFGQLIDGIEAQAVDAGQARV